MSDLIKQRATVPDGEIKLAVDRTRLAYDRTGTLIDVAEIPEYPSENATGPNGTANMSPTGQIDPRR